MVPFLRQLSDHVDDEMMQRMKLGAPRASAAAAAASAVAAAATPDGVRGAGGGGTDGGGPGASGGNERVRLDAERQILLTMLLAHMCSEHDATPRTFVEQVREWRWSCIGGQGRVWGTVARRGRSRPGGGGRGRGHGRDRRCCICFIIQRRVAFPRSFFFVLRCVYGARALL